MDHATIVQALTDGTAFSVEAAAVERIDTFAAHVFLVGERAYKLKRPVRFSVLDFTTALARRRALRDELHLNRRFAPQLYLRTVEIRKTENGAKVPTSGSVEIGKPTGEWLLEMVRFPDDSRLDRVAAQGGLSPDLAERLGATIANLHAKLEPMACAGGVAAFATILDGNRDDLARAPRGLFEQSCVRAMLAASDDALKRHGDLLDERRSAGRVRHCHGDLHLANMVLLDGEPTAFDCIEFDAAIACIDVLYDLAFLLMDLLDQGHKAAAQRVLQGYFCNARGVDEEDFAGLALLPLFMATRAAIRAKVLGLILAELSDADYRRLEADRADGRILSAQRYANIAASLLQPRKAMLVAIGGWSGSGKTTLARELAPVLGAAPGAVVLRSDVIRKAQFGVSPTTRLPAAAYTPERSAAVFARLRADAAKILTAGHSVIVDAVHGQKAERDAIEAVAKAAGVPFAGVWLDGALPLLQGRVEARTGDASDADAAVVARQVATDTGPMDWERLAAGRHTSRLAKAVLALLEADCRASLG